MKLTEKEENWIEQVISLNMKRDDIKKKLEKSNYDETKIEMMLKYYDIRMGEKEIKELESIKAEEEPKEKMKLTFLQKWKIKRFLKGLKKAIKIQEEYIKKIIESQDKITKKQEEDLKEYKEKLIAGILGNKEKNLVGFIDIFELKDDDTGKVVTKGDLERASVNEIMDLTESLIGEMESEL